MLLLPATIALTALKSGVTVELIADPSFVILSEKVKYVLEIALPTWLSKSLIVYESEFEMRISTSSPESETVWDREVSWEEVPIALVPNSRSKSQFQFIHSLDEV